MRNANGFPLRLSGLDYRVKLAKDLLVRGESSRPIAVGAKDSGTVKLKMALDYASLGAAARQLRRARSLPIEIAGEAKMPGPGGTVPLPFSWKGDVPLLR